MKLNKILFLLCVFGLLGFNWPFPQLLHHPNPEQLGTASWFEKQIKIIKSQASNIDLRVLRLSLVAYVNARHKGIDNKQLLTVIDYSKPSTEKRMWVFDMKNGRTLFNTWVSHGRNSGGIQAKSFSNNPGSLQSSLGVFVTEAAPYIGGNGYSLRLRGLEKGINDNAYQRSVVVHGAWYVNPDVIKKYGQIGRSWGCPAVNNAMAKSIIDTIKENTLIFAYYPDHKWLAHSRFLAS